jgi:hypothetical protein
MSPSPYRDAATAVCPKCGSEAGETTKYCDFDGCDSGHKTEHLHKVCRCCGFHRVVPCLDAGAP